MVLAHGKPQLLAEGEVYDHLGTGAGDAPTVAMTTWETSLVPWEIASGLMAYSAVIVPSAFSAEAFKQAFAAEGPEVRIVPHTFDPTFWPHFTGWGADRLAPTTRFYTHGAWSERKNALAVLRAYLHAFTSDDPVHLLIASQDADPLQVRSMTMRSGLGRGIADVQVHTQPLSEEDLQHMHAASDCFVTATRGEGWGLPIFEAALSGKTIIAPRHGGHADFLRVDTFPDPDTGWQYSGWKPIDHVMVPCFAGQPSLITDGSGRVLGERSSLIAGVDCRQTWAEPSVFELAQRMRAVHDQRSAGQVRIHRGDYAVLERRFGYKTVGPMLATTLQEIITS